MKTTFINKRDSIIKLETTPMIEEGVLNIEIISHESVIFYSIDNVSEYEFHKNFRKLITEHDYPLILDDCDAID